MSTQQDIYATSSKNRPPMLKKENYVPWSSRLLRYAKSRPNEKLIYNSIINSPYVRRMIPEPGDPNHEVPVNETFYTILLGLPEDIYAAVDSCETAQEIWLRVQQMMKGSDIGIQDKKAKLFNEWERFTSTDGESIESYYHRQDRQMHMVGGNGGNQFRQYAGQNVGNLNGYNAVQNNPNGNGNLVAARAEGNATGHNADLDEIEEVNASCILMANLHQASTSGSQNSKLPFMTQTDQLRVQNFEIQFLKEAAKFVRDFKSLAKEVDESLAKHKALELEIERLLKEIVSQDIMSIVQNNSVVDSSNLQTELDLFPKVGETYALSKPVTSNLIPTPQESKIMKNDKKQMANVSNVANKKKHKAQVWKLKNVGSKERLASPKPSTPRSCLRWSPTRRLFNLKGKIITSSESEIQSDCSNGDNACTSNPQEPISKWFPNSTFSITGQNWFDTLLILLLFKYKPMDKEHHGDNECET
nr:hypothetical protein [Tanacetum cinerariifolium]